MVSLRLILTLLIICILIPNGLSQEESPDLAEEYIDEELPESSLGESTPKPNNSIEVNPKKTQFSEERFTKLFQSRRERPRPSPLSPKFASKPKPTLPSFIKNTPPIIRVQPTQASNQRSLTQRTTAAPSKATTSRTPLRGSSRNTNQRNQISNNRSQIQSTPSPVSTTESSSRRRFGGSSGARRNSNSTIPAIKPRRT